MSFDGLKQLVEIVLRSRYLRIGAVTIVVIMAGFTVQWYITKERPRAYLAKAYPSWNAFEHSVRGAQAANYEYDPYGALEINLDTVNSFAEGGARVFTALRVPRKFKELHNQSLELFRQYLAAGSSLDAGIKTEADYYYALLTDLRNLFGSARPSFALLGASYADIGDHYESTWRDLERLSNEAGTLVTRVELARAPDRLKNFHQELLAVLRETESLAREGIAEYERFQGAIRGGRYLAVAISLGALRSRFENQAANIDSSLSGFSIDQGNMYGKVRTTDQFFDQTMQSLNRNQRDFGLMLTYFPALSGIGDFYNNYNDFAPPRLPFFGEGGRLSDAAPRGETYAMRWSKYRDMVHAMEGLVSELERVQPPSNLSAFHTDALAVFKEGVSAGRDALGQFDAFNNDITDNRLRTLNNHTARLSTLISQNVDFADVWSLRDLARGRTSVSDQFESVAESWKDALKRYDVMVVSAAE